MDCWGKSAMAMMAVTLLAMIVFAGIVLIFK